MELACAPRICTDSAKGNDQCKDVGHLRLEYAEAVPHLRIALAQINTTVGDISANADLIVEWAERAYIAGAAPGGVPGDGADRVSRRGPRPASSFVEASRAALRPLAARLADEGFGELPVVVGYLDRTETDLPKSAARPAPRATRPRCCTAARCVLTYAKHHLPNYGVFDEFRYFVPGDTMPVLRVHGVDVALAICEDLWQDGGRVPAARSGEARACCSRSTPPRTSATRTTPGWNWSASAPRRRLHDRLPGDGRRPGRAGLRRRLDRRRRGRRGHRPGPAVRRGLRARGPRAAAASARWPTRVADGRAVGQARPAHRPARDLVRGSEPSGASR